MNKDQDQKYIELLLDRCLSFKKTKTLFINYNKEIKEFVDKICNYAKDKGIEEIYLDEDNYQEIHDTLKSLSLEEIKTCKLFDKSIWDKYAKEDATFLMLETEEPGLMDDIEEEKIALSSSIKRKSRPIFRKKEGTNEISWTIAAYPGERWANKLFPNEKDSYQKLYNLIMKMCMVDTNNPIDSWNKYIEDSHKLIEKLNNLKIKKLHYKNNIGTDLYITLPENHIWSGAGEEELLVNMPSYEIFTSPDYRYTEGIVYSSKPLIYNGGQIEDFYIKFKDGKVIDYNAKKGKEILKGIIESDSNSCYLGEVALVNHNSPISNTKVIYETTLFDENASCHLALGDSFPECIKEGLSQSKEELYKQGLNNSQNHVDFMIGTEDLTIEAETKEGTIKIFNEGNFII